MASHQDALVSTDPAGAAARGRSRFGDVEGGVRFWSDVWDAVHLEEIYVEIAGARIDARRAEHRTAP